MYTTNDLSSHFRSVSCSSFVLLFLDGMAAITCQICQEQTGDGAWESLLCGHGFHSSCLSEFSSASGMSITELPCPVCRRTGLSFSEAQSPAADPQPAPVTPPVTPPCKPRTTPPVEDERPIDDLIASATRSPVPNQAEDNAEDYHSVVPPHLAWRMPPPVSAGGGSSGDGQAQQPAAVGGQPEAGTQLGQAEASTQPEAETQAAPSVSQRRFRMIRPSRT